jgi:hypothetical protein
MCYISRLLLFFLFLLLFQSPQLALQLLLSFQLAQQVKTEKGQMKQKIGEKRVTSLSVVLYVKYD